MFSSTTPTTTRKGPGRVAELTLTDLSPTPKWRVFSGHDRVKPGSAARADEALVWSVTPGEWTILGERSDQAVDLTHVRSMFRLTGERASILINRVCGLDLTNDMFPNGAAARTLFAGVSIEIVRDDEDGAASYLILPSSSFRTYIRDVIHDAGAEFGLSPD